MNYIILSYILLYVCHKVCSQDTGSCDPGITDLAGNKVDMQSYCSKEKPCFVKCCAENQVMNSPTTCMSIRRLKKYLANKNLSNISLPLDFSSLKIYKSDNYDEMSSKTIKDFTKLYSKMYMNKSSSDCSFMTDGDDGKLRLTEQGTLLISLPNHYVQWEQIHDFCVDMFVHLNKGIPELLIRHRIMKSDRTSEKIKLNFISIGLLISAFFLLLVLVVYSILPQLRNIQGLLLNAYVATLMAAYIVKSFSLLHEESISDGIKFDCTVVTQIIYFLILASFFWLKVMSFDIWWAFRDMRKSREIHRRGIHVKMMIYAGYVYGMAAAITTFAAIMDNQDLEPHIVKPLFKTCFVSDTFFVYLYVPLIILTSCNCLLFLMTVCNIWRIRRNMEGFDEATNKKNSKNKNRFMLYIKLSSLMGVSWIAEVVQARVPYNLIPTPLYILLNAYNTFIGVIIFFLFVFKKKIFLMLCQRFNIKRWAHQQNQVDSTTGTDLGKESKTYIWTRSTDDSDREEGKRSQ